MADERSVDVDEPRDPQPQPGRRPLASAATRLSPAQEAWGGYATHTLGCPACRDIDRRCEESERLYRAWQAIAVDAYRRLRDAGA